MKNELILILDFGGQYSSLIARRVRELKVYCEVKPYNISMDKIKELNPKGIIFSGGPNSVYDEKSPKISKEIFELGVPVLGICYGCQLMAYTLGGSVCSASEKSEYGKTEVIVSHVSKLLNNLSEKEICWMSHTDYVEKLPDNFKITAKTENCPVAAMEDISNNLYGVQFHPEVNHTPNGKLIIKNFLYDICSCSGDWTMKRYVDEQLSKIKEKVGNGKVLCALSGGVD